MNREPLRDLEGAQGRLSLPRHTPTRAPAPLRRIANNGGTDSRHPLRRGGHRDTQGRGRGVTGVLRGEGNTPTHPPKTHEPTGKCLMLPPPSPPRRPPERVAIS